MAFFNPVKDVVTHLLLKIKNAHTMVLNNFTSINTSTGRVETGGTGANQIPSGVSIQEKNGIIDRLTGDSTGTKKVVTRSGFVGTKPVVGATSDADVLKEVYYVDAENLSLTPPSGSLPCGIIVSWLSGTTCEVYLYTLPELAIRKAAITIAADLAALDARVETAEGDITTIEGDVSTIKGNITSLDGRVTALENA